jgi:long-chain-acyl-CoA dehydrogenase
VWQEAGETGLLGIASTPDHGGLGLDKLSAAIAWEEQAYSLCTGPGFSLHSDIVMPYIENYGSAHLKETYLPRMAAGTCIGAIAMTEPGAGSDLQGLTTTALRAPGSTDYILNGSKTYITNGAMADAVIVVAKTDPEQGARGLSLFVVDADAAGFSRGRTLDKVGMKAQDTAELFFEDVRLPESALLGKEGAGFKMLMQELPQERLLIAALGIGAAEACFELTRTWLHERKAFGTTLIKMPTIRHEMARIKTELASSRAFVDSCLELHNRGQLDTATASMVKVAASETQFATIDRMLQLWGGAGYMKEYPIARAFLDSRVQRVYGGSSEIMIELVSRTI